jgi:hypothetical protein
MERNLAHLFIHTHFMMGVLPAELAGGRLRTWTPIYDTGGEVLFYRVPAMKSKQLLGWVDVAASSGAFGAPILGGAGGGEWDEEGLMAVAAKAARKHGIRKWSRSRVVAYSFPKLAIQFLDDDDEELTMLELWTWTPVPAPVKREKGAPPSNFERWSYLAELPGAVRARNSRSYERELSRMNETLGKYAGPIANKPLNPDRFPVDIDRLRPIVKTDSRVLHFTTLNSDHTPCYELRGQETSVWCVGASVQMLLDFYRYEYTQTRIAVELGLGTPTNPNGLPYGSEGKVVTGLGTLSSNALVAAMNSSPTFNQYRDEILANRPLISFIPGHSRSVAGYTRTQLLFGGRVFTTYQGLLVYDPWPPNAGVITQWENFNTSVYRDTFTAHVTTV